MAIILYLLDKWGVRLEWGCELQFGSLERREQALKQQIFWNVLSYTALPSPCSVHLERRTDYRITQSAIATFSYPRFVGLSNQGLADAESNSIIGYVLQFNVMALPPQCSAYRSATHGNVLDIP